MDTKYLIALRRIVNTPNNIELAITHGQLSFTKNLASSVQLEYLCDNRIEIEKAILQVCRLTAFRIGNYGERSRPGIHTSFINVLTNDTYFSIFNVERIRSRNTAAGKKGAPLKGKRFYITPNFALFKMWQSTELKIPPLSDFSRYMGNLKPVLFTANFNHKEIVNKMQASTIRPINISSKALKEVFNIKSVNTNQHINNPSTSYVNKELHEHIATKGIESNLTTCIGNYDNKLIGKKEVKYRTIPILKDNTQHSTSKTPQEQSHSEWLLDYERGKY